MLITEETPVNFYIGPFQGMIPTRSRAMPDGSRKSSVMIYRPLDEFRNEKLPKMKHYTLIKACCVSSYGYCGDAKLGGHNHKEAHKQQCCGGPSPLCNT
jgi:hypothetical protein